MQFRFRTLLIVLVLGPPVLAGASLYAKRLPPAFLHSADT